MVEYKDFPIDALLVRMRLEIARGADVYFKWTCQGCGERVTADEPNTFSYAGYYHTEKADGTPCGALTIPTGGNMLAIIGPEKEKLSPKHWPSTPSTD